MYVVALRDLSQSYFLSIFYKVFKVQRQACGVGKGGDILKLDVKMRLLCIS